MGNLKSVTKFKKINKEKTRCVTIRYIYSFEIGTVLELNLLNVFLLSTKYPFAINEKKWNIYSKV